MTAVISHTTIDATDAYAQSLFWEKVLGYARQYGATNASLTTTTGS